MARYKPLAVFGIVAAVAPIAAGQITDIPLFQGMAREDFESFTNYRDNPNRFEPEPMEILDGLAFAGSLDENIIIYKPGYADYMLDRFGNAGVVDGAQALALDPGGNLMIVFRNPAVDFGAFFGCGRRSYDRYGFLNATFYDQNFEILTQKTFFYHGGANNKGGLEWHGWHSTKLIGAIEFNAHNLAVDSLRVNVVPEPPPLFTLLICLLVIRFWNHAKR